MCDRLEEWKYVLKRHCVQRGVIVRLCVSERERVKENIERVHKREREGESSIRSKRVCMRCLILAWQELDKTTNWHLPEPIREATIWGSR